MRHRKPWRDPYADNLPTDEARQQMLARIEKDRRIAHWLNAGLAILLFLASLLFPPWRTPQDFGRRYYDHSFLLEVPPDAVLAPDALLMHWGAIVSLCVLIRFAINWRGV